MPSMSVWLAYCCVGAVTGLIAGLLGVGGGIIVVPALYWIFSIQGIAQAELMHLALGTSLATIVFTSFSSFRAHARRQAVRWEIFTRFTPGILLGSIAGSWLAARLSSSVLRGAFVALLFCVSTQMLLRLKPAPTRRVPGTFALAGTAGIIGAVANLVGVGGGLLTVPFLSWCNVPIREAVGTAAAVGFPIALIGAAGYYINGSFAAELPPLCAGYISLPALLGIVTMSVLFAKVGAHLAHTVPVGLLKRLFAMFLLVMASHMLYSILTR